jgi:hypothetical protein
MAIWTGPNFGRLYVSQFIKDAGDYSVCLEDYESFSVKRKMARGKGAHTREWKRWRREHRKCKRPNLYRLIINEVPR